MDDILKDSRFTKLVNDPRYRQIPKNERKVKVDKRFQSMFNSDKFKVKYTVDKRGRPVNQSSSEDLKKYYELSSDEKSEGESSDEEQSVGSVSENEGKNESFGAYVLRPKSDSEEEEDITQTEKKKSDEETKDEEISSNKLIRGELPKDVKKKLRDLEVDYARGEGVLFSDSSSDEESAEEEEPLEHGWGELDGDADTTDDATPRFAVCNMDWDNIKASDLYVLFTSFLPPGGLIKSVTIYPSEFGLKRMQEEELRGPMELTEKNIDNDGSSDEGNEEGSKYHMEKLRQYQLNRLKYYYAVVECDSVNTASKIYTDCDGIEYESSATKLDLRFIPDDITFDQEIHDQCLEIMDVSRYKPRLFTTTALQQAKVELTWDAANPHRTEVLRGAVEGDIHDEDLKNYLACSSEEESDVEEQEKEEDKKEESVSTDPISKYKALLQEIKVNEDKKKNRGVEMEITWGLGLKEKTEELVKKKLTKGDKLTPFEELVEKRKEKKKARKLERKKLREKESAESDKEDGYSSDDVPSDIDMNDPYFAEEFDNPEFEKKSNKSKKKTKKQNVESENSDNEEEVRKRAELELLLDDDDGKQHFSLKKIQDAENETKSKRKRKYKESMKHKEKMKETVPDNFEIDVKDQRFSALFTSHHYNIDPSDPNFKKTKAMDSLIQEKLKRRPSEYPEEPTISKKSKKDAEMSILIKSIKRKTQNTSGK